MGYRHDEFVVLGLSVTVALFALAAALAAGSYVFYRSALLEKEIATRRVLGARRSHIVRMLLLETLPGLLGGGLFGIAVATHFIFATALPTYIVLISAALSSGAAACGALISARRAAHTPFSKSGLFCTGSDERGA